MKVRIRDLNFKIHEKYVEDVVKTIRNLANDGKLTEYNTVIFKDKAFGLYDMFKEIKYNLEKTGEYYEIHNYIISMELKDEETVFNAIAKYVEKGSYIEYMSEDNYLFRYVFDGKQCKELEGVVKITWR